MSSARHRVGHSGGRVHRVTETQLDVLRLISQGKHLGDYVPRYKPGRHRGFGAFPMTIAARAAQKLYEMGLVMYDDDRWRTTPAGDARLQESERS